MSDKPQAAGVEGGKGAAAGGAGAAGAGIMEGGKREGEISQQERETRKKTKVIVGHSFICSIFAIVFRLTTTRRKEE